MSMTQVIFGKDNFSEFVLTVFEDGSSVMARPINEPWEHTRLHDPLHTYLAEKLGWDHSPSLWKVAHPDDTSESSDTLAYEESAVLRCQKYLLERF